MLNYHLHTAFVLFGLTILLPTVANASASPIENLEVMSNEFPQVIHFRGSPIRGRGISETDIHDAMDLYNGKTDKYISEELSIGEDYFDTYKKWQLANPSKLMILHLNGEARGIRYPEVQKRYFPGHWVYYPGTGLSNSINANDEEIALNDISIFKSRYFGSPDKNGQPRMPDVIIVKLDEYGNRLWRQSEYASVKKIDQEKSTIILQRGVYGSSARSFTTENTYIAPMVSGWWGGQMWFYNLSSVCPMDENGKTAADLYLEEIEQWFGPGGKLESLHGIGFDVNYIKTKWPHFDVDNDGIEDDGIATDGRNLWREGDWEFLNRLRERMGENFIIMADGWNQSMQMAVGVLNGIESEGLCAPNDGWRLFGRLLNIHTYWNQHNTTKHRFSYITGKLKNPEDIPNGHALRRLGAATASCLGVSYTSSGDYLRKDQATLTPELTRNGPWLGKPLGPMTMNPDRAKDLLKGQGVKMTKNFVNSMKAENCVIKRGKNGELIIKGTATNKHENIILTLPSIDVKKGDVVLMFEAYAKEGLSGFKQTDLVPRQIVIHAEGLPEYSDNNNHNRLFNDTMALMGTPGFTQQYAYFRKAGEGNGPLQITLTIEEQGECEIRNIVYANGPITLAREFEHGVVLANASQEAVEFDLEILFPDSKKVSLKRIKLVPEMFTDPDDTLVRSMLQVNDGTKVDNRQIKLPPLDGLFLVREK